MADIFRKMIVDITAIAIFAAILDVFTEDRSGGFGFRAVCGLTVMLSITEAFREMINL